MSSLRSRPALILIALFVLSIPFVTPYLRGDGVGYYAWLRSPLIDHDLGFENEYRAADPAFHLHAFDPDGELKAEYTTSTGHIRNQYGVGPAVMWSPFVVVGHVSTKLLRAAGAHVPENGYSLPYLWPAAFASALYAFGALFVAYRLSLRFARPWASFFGVIAIWGASSLLVYQYFLPFWPFASGAFVGTLLLLVWIDEGWGVRRWATLGILCGLLLAIHPVAAGWLLLPALSLAGYEKGRLTQRLAASGVFGAGSIVGALPQLVGKWIVIGSPFSTGYGPEIDPFRPRFLHTLFGADHGLVSWTPVTGVALVGIAGPLWKRDRRLAVGLLVSFLGLLYVSASHTTSDQSSFGSRFLVLFTPGFVIGAAAIAEALWKRRALLVAAATVLVVWNLLFMFQWAWGLIPKRGPVAWGEVARNQVTTAPREALKAARLLVTDRGELVRTVQRKDLERIKAGAG